MADGLEPVYLTMGHSGEFVREVQLFNDHNLFNESEVNLNYRQDKSKSDGRHR